MATPGSSISLSTDPRPISPLHSALLCAALVGYPNKLAETMIVSFIFFSFAEALGDSWTDTVKRGTSACDEGSVDASFPDPLLHPQANIAARAISNNKRFIL